MGGKEKAPSKLAVFLGRQALDEAWDFRNSGLELEESPMDNRTTTTRRKTAKCVPKRGKSVIQLALIIWELVHHLSVKKLVAFLIGVIIITISGAQETNITFPQEHSGARIEWVADAFSCHATPWKIALSDDGINFRNVVTNIEYNFLPNARCHVRVRFQPELAKVIRLSFFHWWPPGTLTVYGPYDNKL